MSFGTNSVSYRWQRLGAVIAAVQKWNENLGHEYRFTRELVLKHLNYDRT